MRIRFERHAQRSKFDSHTHLRVALATLLLLSAAAPAASAPDMQNVAAGNGVASASCISAGTNATLDSTPAGDDTVPSPPSLPQVLAGADGICDSTAAGDDVQVIPVGQGSPNTRAIISGRDVVNDDRDNGVCDNTVIFLPGSDDVVITPTGQSTPQQVGVIPGLNVTLDTTAAGDDVVSAIVCPGTNSNIDSSNAGDDLIDLNSVNCFPCVSPGNSCITPGPDGILQTTASGDDFTLPVILTGADGINDSPFAGDDENVMAVGEGFQPIPGFSETTVCTDTGSNGIAESTLCGNSVIDITATGVDEECDDGNLTNDDGCDDDAATGGNCTFTACGNGVTAGTEECDDGNNIDGDGCQGNCELPECGDDIIDPGEECDDGNTTPGDGCDASCLLEPFCGDGNIDAGETCDDGNSSNADDCPNTCVPASCGDGFTCSDLSCMTGPGGGPEDCDDGNATPGDGCENDCSNTANVECRDGVINGNCSAGQPASIVCEQDSDCDTSMGAGDGVCDLEQCDDGNNSDNDACPTTCFNAVCGDGFIFNNGGPEECDDGNTVSGDGCNSSCQLECGNGQLDGGCTAGRPFGTSCNDNDDCDSSPGAGDGTCILAEQCDRGCGRATGDGECASGLATGTACNTNADCDTVPGALDGLCLGSTCGPGCTGSLVAGPQTKCTAGNTGASCTTNTDCDTGPPDGVCSGPVCDTTGALDLFCGVGVDDCSDTSCLIPVCGNGEQECDEECDLGALNGVADSGCESDCTRVGVVGRRELTSRKECHSAWTIDNPPAPINLDKTRQTCVDNTACDANPAVGTCTFSVGLCFARPGVGTCVPADIKTFELRRVKVTEADQAAATQTVTAAVRALIANDEAPPPFAFIPDRCRKGIKKSTCDIPNDHECDTSLGKGNGRCDIGTGVVYEPWLPPAVSGSVCTDSFEIDVPQGERLKLKSITSPVEGEGRPDRDKIILECD